MPRRLGQHFLSDPRILDRIVDALDPAPDDVVIEVGPGKGSLTRRLAGRVGSVIAIERDERLATELREALSGKREAADGKREVGNGQFASDRQTGSADADGEASALAPFRRSAVVVHADALTLDWHGLLHRVSYPVPRSPFAVPSFKVIGNIPYYITSPLIDKALTPPRPTVTVFLMQREVADRLVAEPGSKAYGAITVGVRAVAHVERLFTVKPGSFRPPPRVDSAVVRLEPLDSPLVTDDEVSDFRRFVTGLFSQRRKQLARSLRDQVSDDRKGIETMLNTLGIDPDSRSEALFPDQFVLLFRTLPR